jgi:hypothetical protein
MLQHRGGYGQHAAAFRSTAVPLEGASSECTKRLLQLFSWGLLSANMVQWLAEGFVLSGFEHNEIKGLTELGAKGKHPANVRRDLLRKYCRKLTVPKPLWISVSLKIKRAVVDGMHPMINPCEVMESIYRSHRPLFTHIFGTHLLETFWNQAWFIVFS